MEASHDIRAHDLATQPKTLTVLGATGSIGTSTLDLVARNKDKYTIEALTANKNVDVLADLARRFNAKMAVIGRQDLYQDLKQALSGTGIAVAAGDQGLVEAASRRS